MTTGRSNQIVDFLFNEYIDECGRDGMSYENEPRQDVLTDLLTDIRHYCDTAQLDFELAVQRSSSHKVAESSEPSR